MSAGFVSNMELELLRTRLTSAERAAVSIGPQRDNYRVRLSTYSVRVINMFASMHESDCPM